MNMSQVRVWNTKQSGTLEFLVFGKDKEFIGVCLTLDIVEDGDDPTKLMESIKEAAEGHVKLVQEKNLDDSLLNRLAPDEYWQLYYQVLDSLKEKAEQNSFISTAPIRPLVHA
jgi:predicted RNase H-like HicB family nuclease